MATTITTGNTLMGPPRLTGDYTKDAAIVQRWLQDLFDQVAKAQNLIGTQADLVARVAALEAKMTTLTARVHALDGH